MRKKTTKKNKKMKFFFLWKWKKMKKNEIFFMKMNTNGMGLDKKMSE